MAEANRLTTGKVCALDCKKAKKDKVQHRMEVRKICK